jgi:hypothetical protein
MIRVPEQVKKRPEVDWQKMGFPSSSHICFSYFLIMIHEGKIAGIPESSIFRGSKQIKTMHPSFSIFLLDFP